MSKLPDAVRELALFDPAKDLILSERLRLFAAVRPVSVGCRRVDTVAVTKLEGQVREVLGSIGVPGDAELYRLVLPSSYALYNPRDGQCLVFVSPENICVRGMYIAADVADLIEADGHKERV